MQHKALLLSDKLSAGGAWAVQPVPSPQPGPGCVGIAVHAAALNPLDTRMAGIGLFVKSWPAVFGFDAAGVVTKLGEGVTGFAVGDRVLFEGTFVDPPVATYQQYVAMRAEFVAKVPDNLTLDEAATIPLTLATAALGLYDARQAPFGGLALTPPWAPGGRSAYAGEPIVITAGASGVGQHAIQLAKLSGFAPIITTASPANAAYVESLGATHVLDRHAPLSSLAATVASLTDKPVKYAYDAVGTAETQRALYDLVVPGGGVALVKESVLDKAEVAAGDKHVARVFADVQMGPQQAIGKALYAALTGMLAAGEIKPTKLDVLPNGLEGIPEGLERLGKGVSALKLVAHPQETA
ncbi:zinc-binding alcohol dehydrogenase family protein [Phanerochaete sordida]|uniref:Zinc-binding alcohol dehydrogenase family protein n=1 Tax=Phanerochaete sordida TaxID=48140 RepID=A0A9P3LC57_9APHY|nr:zinc-binding alcohol dehydrogenase family protein [Phanerochaete sordida]